MSYLITGQPAKMRVHLGQDHPHIQAMKVLWSKWAILVPRSYKVRESPILPLLQQAKPEFLNCVESKALSHAAKQYHPVLK